MPGAEPKRTIHRGRGSDRHWTLAVAGVTLMFSVTLAGAAVGGGAHNAQAPRSRSATRRPMCSTRTEDSVTYWNNIKHEFEAAHPGVTLELQPHGGTDTDEMNAIALQFRSPSTTPDVIQLPTTYIGQFESSGYLLALDKYLEQQSVLVAVSEEHPGRRPDQRPRLRRRYRRKQYRHLLQQGDAAEGRRGAAVDPA